MLEKLLHDASFWVAVAFVLFAIFVVWKAVPGMLKSLDKQSEAIRDKIDEARLAREEAEKLLAEYKRKHSQALDDAQKIIDKAKEQTQGLKAKAAADLEELLERRKVAAQEKIAQAEANATQEVKTQAVAFAVMATQQILAKQITDTQDQDLIDQAIAALPQQLQ